MSQKQPMTKVRILVTDHPAGPINTVVEIPSDQVRAGIEAHQVDDHPASIAAVSQLD